MAVIDAVSQQDYAKPTTRRIFMKLQAQTMKFQAQTKKDLRGAQTKKGPVAWMWLMWHLERNLVSLLLM